MFQNGLSVTLFNGCNSVSWFYIFHAKIQVFCGSGLLKEGCKLGRWRKVREYKRRVNIYLKVAVCMQSKSKQRKLVTLIRYSISSKLDTTRKVVS